MLSRASSSYLAQDEETSKKIQSAWIGLGSIFAPLLEKIANFTIKAVKYINVFIKALTGTDFLANAMAKSMNKANKSAGKLSKTLAGFDELTNLDDSTSGASIDTSWIDAFKNVELDPNITKKFEDLGKKVKSIYEQYIKPVFSWMWEHKEVVIAVFAGWKVATWFGNIMSLIGTAGTGLAVGTGLAGLAALLVFLSSIAVITLAVKGANEVNEAFGSVTNVAKNNTETVKNMTERVKEFWDTGKYSQEQKENYINSIKAMIDSNNDLIKDLESKKNWFTFITGGNKKIDESIREVQEQSNLLRKSFEELTGKKYGDIEIKAKIDTKQPQSFFDKLKNTFVSFGLGMLNIPKFDVGTNYVPNDTLAVVHKGESVVPKRFNSDEYFSRLGTNNSEETNRLLEELIDRVERIDINPYTTIKDVGNASVNYINKQSRIMGRGVI